MKNLIWTMALFFVLTCEGELLASSDAVATATVMKITGHEITLKTANGQITTINNDPTGITVGQEVSLKNGRIMKDNKPSAGSSITTSSPGVMKPSDPISINPQPEPPGIEKAITHQTK